MTTPALTITSDPVLSSLSHGWLVAQVQSDSHRVSVFAHPNGSYSEITVYDGQGRPVAVVDAVKHTVTVVNGTCPARVVAKAP